MPWDIWGMCLVCVARGRGVCILSILHNVLIFQTAELGSAAPEIVFNKKFRAPNIILHVIFMSDCAPSTPQHDRQGLSNRLLTQPHYMDTNSGVVRFLIFDHAVISERQGREAYSGTDRGSSPEKF